MLSALLIREGHDLLPLHMPYLRAKPGRAEIAAQA